MQTITEKYCSRCQQRLPITKFGNNKARKDGVSTYCKQCTSERYKESKKTIYNTRRHEQVIVGESWREIIDYPQYEASNFGRIRNKKYYRLMTPSTDLAGYKITSIVNANGTIINIKIHRIVAQTWIENPLDKPTVNHKNKNRGDNNVENLEWATYEEQSTHKYNFNQKKNTIRCSKSSWLSKSTDNNTSFDDEVWACIEDGFDKPKYVSSYGRIKFYSLSGQRITYGSNAKGYKSTAIRSTHSPKSNRAVHILVATAFIPNPQKKKIVNHKDGDKINNHVDNLEWCTQSENIQHAYKTGLIQMRAVTKLDLQGHVLHQYESVTMAAESLNTASTSDICRAAKHGFKFKNYMWVYTENLEAVRDKPWTPPIKSNEVGVIQLSKNGTKELFHHRSLAAAAAHLGKKGGGANIRLAALGKLQSAYGFTWKLQKTLCDNN